MSQLKTNSITNIGNTGDPNIVLGDSGDVQVQSLNSGPLGGMRSQIINGDLTVSQRIGFNSYSTGISNVYTADRWFFYISSGVGDVRIRTQNQMWSTAADQGLNGSLQVANATGAYSIRQAIEIPITGTPGKFVEGSTWTVSLYSQVQPSVNVTWSEGIQPGSGNFKNIVTQPNMVSLGNDRWSHTFTIGASDGPLANSNCLMVSFNTVADQTQNNQFEGFQLESGSVATPFEHRPIGTELALCQRYFQTVDHLALTMSQPSNTALRRLSCPRTVTMRVTPTESATTNSGTTSFPNSSATNIGALNSTAANTSQVLLTNYTADAEL